MYFYILIANERDIESELVFDEKVYITINIYVYSI
jgi:hypothetical protein